MKKLAKNSAKLNYNVMAFDCTCNGYTCNCSCSPATWQNTFENTQWEKFRYNTSRVRDGK
mgnify:CR=1 FL=1